MKKLPDVFISKSIFCFIFCFCLCLSFLPAQDHSKQFTVIPLGVKGGGDESNLSSYLVAPRGDSNFICLDAGTLRAGIQKAIDKGIFNSSAEYILQHNIQAYFISHPHLDHLAGLVLNSPDDKNKPIYGLPFCMNTMAEKYFSWKSWANFTDRGEAPQLKKYVLTNMKTDSFYVIEKTPMEVAAFPLSHAAPFESTAFLIKHDNAYLLYLGDTGADTIEKSTRLNDLWRRIAPLIMNKQLKGIFIEVSYSNDQKPDQLFGHLTPDLLMKELTQLANLCGGKSFLENLPLIITHCKPGGNREKNIKTELSSSNRSGVQLIFASQATPIHL